MRFFFIASCIYLAYAPKPLKLREAAKTPSQSNPLRPLVPTSLADRISRLWNRNSRFDYTNGARYSRIVWHSEPDYRVRASPHWNL